MAHRDSALSAEARVLSAPRTRATEHIVAARKADGTKPVIAT